MGRGGMNREQYSFGQFLGHPFGHLRTTLQEPVAAQKTANTWSAIPELQAYMKTHPDAQSQMAKDPDSFLKARSNSVALNWNQHQHKPLERAEP